MSFGIGEFYSVACALAWATAVILFKKSGESLAPVPLNLVKNVIGLALFAVTMLALHGATLPEVPASAVWLALFSGFLGIGVGDTLYFRALNAIGAARMAVAQTAYTPGVILLSLAFLGERLSALQSGGVALVLGGILLVTWMPSLAPLDARRLRAGFLWAALSVFLMAAGVVIAKPLLERYDFIWIVTLRVLGGFLGLVVFVAFRSSLAELRTAYAGVRHWGIVIAGGVIGTYISMILWLAGYKYTDASIAAVLNETAALFILALSVLLLRERVTPRQCLGTLLAMAGVVLVVVR